MAVIEAIVTFLSRFATQLIMAMLLFAPALKKRKLFWVRLVISVTVYSVFPYALAGFGVYPIYNFPYLRLGWLNLNWAVIFFLGMLVMLVCFDITVPEALFYGSAAYAMQNCARNIGTIITNIFSIQGGSFGHYFTIMLAGWAVLAILYAIFVRRIKKGEALGIKNNYILILSAAMFAIVYVLSVFVMTEPERTQYSGKIYAVICCTLLLFIQFSLFDQSKKDREREEIEKMLHSEQEVHKISRENIELINIKCHDLKHQIAAIRAMPDDEKKEASLKDIENAVMIYDSVAKTGNDTLDLILSEKSLICEKHHIKFSYMANIDRLGAIDDLDLYSLLGNALDNAIEEVVNLDDPEMRIISLNIENSGDLIRLHIENYTANNITFEDGLPVTTKADKKYHGFGIKSIRYITEKYKGHFNLYIKDNIFNLDILLPAAK